MSNEIQLLLWTAAVIGFIHTILGPDHYLPFIVMARAKHWSFLKITGITFLCGIGHVASSVLVGMIGILLGIAVSSLETLESLRGGFAGWFLITFGIVYSIWGFRKAMKNRPHKHIHAHDDNTHSHIHRHVDHHSHVHSLEDGKDITPWILFTIFVFGPCEPLIPLLMYPAAKNSLIGTVMVTSIFAIITISTMLTIVCISFFGVSKISFGRFERYSHALAGFTILLCGVTIQFLGL